MKTSSPDLSIVIPALREEKRIGKTLDELARFLKTDKYFRPLGVEVLVVAADAPGDKTKEITLTKVAKFANLRLLRPGKKVGKGRDVQYGMLRAKGRAVIFMDADLATPLRHLEKFHKTYLKGVAVVSGTRNLRKHHPSVSRRLVSNIGNVMFRLASGIWMEDSQCGFKMFSQDASRLCFKKLSVLGWGFDMEVLAIARVNKLPMKFYRINDWTSVPEGTFMEGVLKNSVVSLMELLKIAYHRLNGSFRVKIKS